MSIVQVMPHLLIYLINVACNSQNILSVCVHRIRTLKLEGEMILNSNFYMLNNSIILWKNICEVVGCYNSFL